MSEPSFTPREAVTLPPTKIHSGFSMPKGLKALSSAWNSRSC